ncbi:MAG: hypothetical protein EXR80_02305 [Methylococcales bacterium]|nr:hypothetical protein [Methylococcales bacterium]
MTEVLFVLTVIYVAYVLYVVNTNKKAIVKSITPVPAAEPEKQAVSVEQLPIEPVPKKKPAKTLNTEIPKSVKSTTTKQPTATKKGLKDPKTGDIATTYSNYIFTKRWIKEALVSEGLLEKVYKNHELTAEVEASIKVAIAKLETMAQYQV